MKYAAEEGWSFSVITQDIKRTVIPEQRLSQFLLDEVPAGTNILRVGNPFFGQTLTAKFGRKIAGQSSLPWGIAAALQGWKKFRHAKPDLIFVNSPPFTNVAIGLTLSAIFKVPLIVDMKDDWVDSPTFWKKGRLRRSLESWTEHQVVKRASAVITVTRSSYESSCERYSTLGLDHKFFFIPNGQDLEEYRVLQNRERKRENQRFLLLSAAAGYRPDYRDLTPFLQALEKFVERCPQARDQIMIEFLGEGPNTCYQTWLEGFLPTSAVQYSGVLDRQALVERLWKTDLFFLIQPRENYTAISGTLYEYWATGKAPVLLFAEAGASSDLVVTHQLGERFDFNQTEEASRYIERIFQAYHEQRPLWIERTGVEGFDRRKMARQMLSIWTDIINTSRRW